MQQRIDELTELLKQSIDQQSNSNEQLSQSETEAGFNIPYKFMAIVFATLYIIGQAIKTIKKR